MVIKSVSLFYIRPDSRVVYVAVTLVFSFNIIALTAILVIIYVIFIKVVCNYTKHRSYS